jgi:hypothetical protein
VDFLAAPVSMVLQDPRDRTTYVALNHGHFGVKLHALPEGESWRELPAPAYAQDEPGRVCQQGGPLDNKPPSVLQVWSLEAGGQDQPGFLWAGTIPGGLFRSRDRGQSWELIRSLWDRPERAHWMGGGADQPGIHSICVDPRDSRRVSVGVSCGGMWVTTDGGESWACRAKGMFAAYMPPQLRDDPNIQDPHRIVQCPAAPDVLWAQHHNGIFRTTDAGQFWQTIPQAGPSTFGFGVVVHPRDPQTAWFVPATSDEVRVPVDAKVVVTRTRDGGKTFQTLAEGLPSQPAYDLVYRHALDVDATGNRLAFGSTTGGLWISENAGDSWWMLPTRLPPVYCVRFGG